MDETVALPEPDTTLNLSDLSFYFAVLSLVPPLVVEPPKKCSPGWLDTLKSVHDHLDAYRKLVTNLQICEDTCTEELREGQECNCCNHRSRSRKVERRGAPHTAANAPGDRTGCLGPRARCPIR